MMVTDNTCLIVQVYFFEKIDISHWDHSEVCPRLVSLPEIQGESTGRHGRRAGVILRDIGKGPASHREAPRAREKGAAVAGLGDTVQYSNKEVKNSRHRFMSLCTRFTVRIWFIVHRWWW
jgi:hypothetical protein